MPPTRRPCQSLGVLLRCCLPVSSGAGTTIAASAKCGGWVAMGRGATGFAAVARRSIPHRFRRRLAGTVDAFIAFVSGAGAGQSNGALALQWPRVGDAGSTPGPDARPACTLPASADAVADSGHACAQPARCNRRSPYGRLTTRRAFAGLVNPAAVHPGTDLGQWSPASCLAGPARYRASAVAGLPRRADDHPSAICYCSGAVHQRCRMTREQLE